MVHYKFKAPNLLEVIILVVLFLTVVFGYKAISTVIGQPIETSSLSWEGLQAIFSWLSLIALLLIAAILESIREKL